MIVRKQAEVLARAAFTLMEMLVVVAIIVTLAGLSVTAIFGALDSAKLKTAKMGAKNLEQAVMGYYTEYGIYPQSLEILLQPDQETGKARLEQRQLFDPWNNPYQYQPQNLSLTGIPLIFSNGPPSKPKQISNWDK
jgi:general secretion pathway protein G